MKVFILLSLFVVGSLQCLKDSTCFQCTLNTLCAYVEQENGETFCIHTRKIPMLSNRVVRKAIAPKQCLFLVVGVTNSPATIHTTPIPTTSLIPEITTTHVYSPPRYSQGGTALPKMREEPISTTMLPSSSSGPSWSFKGINNTHETTQRPISITPTPVLHVEEKQDELEEITTSQSGDLFYDIPILETCAAYGKGETKEFRLIRSLCNMGRLSDLLGSWEGRDFYFYKLNPAHSYKALCAHVIRTSKKCFPKTKRTNMHVNWQKRVGMGSAIFNKISLSLECNKNVTLESTLERLGRTSCIVAKRTVDINSSSLNIYQTSFLNLNMAFEFPAQCAVLFDKRQRCFQ